MAFGPGLVRPVRRRTPFAKPAHVAASAWCGASSTTTVPGRLSQTRDCNKSSSTSANPGVPLLAAPATRASWGSVRTLRIESGPLLLAHVGRIGYDQIDPAPELGGQRAQPVALEQGDRRPDGRRAFLHPRQIGRCDVERVAAGVDGPHRGRAARRAPRPTRGRWPPTPCRRRPPRGPQHRPDGALRASATSTTCSVSGRGMSTRGSTNRSSERNGQ